MSNSQVKKQRTFLKQQDPFSSRPMEKSTPLRSKSKVQYIDQMTKSFYSKGFTEEKQSTLMQSTHSYTANKAFKSQQFVLKKHQNKKFDKLVSLVGYAINSADKALKFLNVSCNFQAEFACKLYYSDRQTLMKEFNNFSIQECLASKGMHSSSNSSQIKIIPFDQSILLAESKQLRHENQLLKKELIVIEGQLGKDRKSEILKSKSNHSFFSQHQPSQFKNLLMNKCCEEQFLKTEFDFVERQHCRMENLLIKICKNSEIYDFLQLIKKQSKYKLQSLNSEHSFGERRSFDNLSIISEKKIEALQEKILGDIQRIRQVASYNEVISKQSSKMKQAIQVIAKTLDLDLQLQEDMVKLAQKACKSFIKKGQKQMMLVQAEYENELAKTIQKIQKISNEKESQFQSMLDEKDMSLDTLLAEKQSLLQELQDTQRTNTELMDQAKQMYQQLKEYKLVKTKEQQQFLRENKNLKEQIKRLKEQSAYDMKNSQKILQINEDLQRSCSEKQLLLQKEKQENLRLQSEIQLKRRYIIKKDKDLQRKSTIITELQYKYDLLASSDKQTDQRIQILQAEKDHLQQQLQQNEFNRKLSNQYLLIQNKKIQESDKYNATLKQTLQSQQEQGVEMLQAKDKEIQSLELEKSKLLNQLVQQKALVQQIKTQLSKEISNQRSKFIERDDKTKYLDLKIQALIQDNKTLKDQFQEQIANRKKNLNEYQTKSRTLNTQNQELHKLLNDNRQKSKESITALQQLMQHLKEQNQQAKNENNQLKNTIHILKDQIKMKTESHLKEMCKVERLTLERDDLLNKLTQMNIKHEKVVMDIQKKHQNQVNTRKKEVNELFLSTQQLKKDLEQSKILLESAKIRQSLRQSQIQRVQTSIDGERSRYEGEIKRLEQQLQQSKQKLKTMEKDLSSKSQQSSNLKAKLEQENESLKQQIARKDADLNRKIKQIQAILAQKEHIIEKKKQYETQLEKQIKSQAELIEELTSAKIALQNEIKDRQAAEGIMEDLANPSAFHRQVSIISKEEENNFQDFSEYIQQKMQESFISIINSQAMKSFSESKAEDILEYEPSKIKQSHQSEDEFEDFSSSHHRTEDMMFSMDSYHDPEQLMEHSMTFKPLNLQSNNILKLGDQQLPKILHEYSLGLGLQTSEEDGASLHLSFENSQRIWTKKSQGQNWLSSSLTIGIFSKPELANQCTKERRKIRRTPKKYSLFKEQNDK